MAKSNVSQKIKDSISESEAVKDYEKIRNRVIYKCSWCKDTGKIGFIFKTDCFFCTVKPKLNASE